MAQEKPILTVEFNNLANNDGNIMLLIKDSNEKEVASRVLLISKGKALVQIPLQSGAYGISAYHDENANEELDMNFLGAPTEPYGFSNDARGIFGKPEFEETLINVNASKTVTFELK